MAPREKGGFWVGVGAVLFYPLAWLGRRVERGAERVPRQGGGILVLNHVSHLDPAIDAVFVHRNRRVPRFLAKESLFRAPLFGKVISGAGNIPVYRGSTDAKDSLRAAIDALADGKLVVIYPEGTITKDPDGWPMVSRTGVARLALSTLDMDKEVPVLPAARWGTNRILDGYAKKFRPFPRKTVHVAVGEPVDLSAYRGVPVDGRVLREVTDLLMTRVRDLLAEIRQEPAPEEFFQPSSRGEKSGQ